MYRYSVDNAITYSSEDFVLFREAPFACWMERLTLENPDHGIPPDAKTALPESTMERQDDVADTLRAEGRNVVLIDWEERESRRRSATLDAMRSGADFIVNAQLALGPLSGSANLLMRTSGFSELGDFLYVPCDTQAKTTLHSAFRLCFLADLLHSLQGQLPPQMLIIRGGSDVMPLDTEDHIYHYRAVKHRFMETMRSFRKHRMPDPSESSHFGRWSECANEVLKQRLLQEGDESSPGDGIEAEEEFQQEPLLAAGMGNAIASPVNSAVNPAQADSAASLTGDARRVSENQVVADAAPTLAEQAVKLAPGAYARGATGKAPGHTPNLARVMAAVPVSSRRRVLDTAPAVPEHGHERRESDVTLENLSFIGSSIGAPSIGAVSPAPARHAHGLSADMPELPPGPEKASTAYQFPEQGEFLSHPAAVPEEAPASAVHADTPLSLMVETESTFTASQGKAHPLDSGDNKPVAPSVVDMDSSPLASSSVVAEHAAAGFSWEAMDEALTEPDFLLEGADVNIDEKPGQSFSNSLITNHDYSD